MLAAQVIFKFQQFFRDLLHLVNMAKVKLAVDGKLIPPKCRLPALNNKYGACGCRGLGVVGSNVLLILFVK